MIAAGQGSVIINIIDPGRWRERSDRTGPRVSLSCGGEKETPVVKRFARFIPSGLVLRLLVPFSTLTTTHFLLRRREKRQTTSMLVFYLCLSILPSLSFGYSFDFTSTPTQCSNLSLSIAGTGGQPPYSVLLIPFGPSTLPNNTEARRITQQNFSGTDTTLSFQLKFPSNSQFVAVVSFISPPSFIIFVRSSSLLFTFLHSVF